MIFFLKKFGTFKKLHTVFKELINKSEKKNEISANPNVLSFQYSNGVDCTILVGKTASLFSIFSK